MQQQYCRASSTIESQSSGDQASTHTNCSISIDPLGSFSGPLEAAMTGAAKPDEDDQDRQDYKKQRSAEPYSMSRGEKEKVERSKTNKRVVCFYQRGANFMSSANPTESYL